MRTIGRSAVALTLFASFMLAAEQTPLASLAGIATSLSEGDSDGALAYFDSHIKNFGELQQKLEALAEQADVSCAIDIVTDDEADGVQSLVLDWYMELKPQSGNGALERRREKVSVEMKLSKGVWKITAIAPINIFDPINIK